MQILGTLSSPFTRKVRIVALELGVPFDFVVTSPFVEGSNVLSLNPLAKVPVLVHDDGSALVDSSLIASWLCDSTANKALLPVQGPQRTAILQWEAIADGVMDAALLMRMESLRPAGEQSPSWAARQESKVRAGMQWMNRELGGREFCVGERLSLADIALACALSYLEFRLAETPWRKEAVNIARSAEMLEQRPSLKSTGLRA